MTTLETQYKIYLEKNPSSELTYKEWFDKIFTPHISSDFQIGPDGAYEHEEDTNSSN